MYQPTEEELHAYLMAVPDYRGLDSAAQARVRLLCCALLRWQEGHSQTQIWAMLRQGIRELGLGKSATASLDRRTEVLLGRKSADTLASGGEERLLLELVALSGAAGKGALITPRRTDKWLLLPARA
jgi:hypothetical protein